MFYYTGLNYLTWKGDFYIYLFFFAICRYQTPGRIVSEQAPGTVSLEAQHEGNAVQQRSNAIARHQLVCCQQPQPIRFHRQSGHDFFAVHMRPTETSLNADQFARVCEYLHRFKPLIYINQLILLFIII